MIGGVVDINSGLANEPGVVGWGMGARDRTRRNEEKPNIGDYKGSHRKPPGAINKQAFYKIMKKEEAEVSGRPSLSFEDHVVSYPYEEGSAEDFEVTRRLIIENDRRNTAQREWDNQAAYWERTQGNLVNARKSGVLKRSHQPDLPQSHTAAGVLVAECPLPANRTFYQSAVDVQTEYQGASVEEKGELKRRALEAAQRTRTIQLEASVLPRAVLEASAEIGDDGRCTEEQMGRVVRAAPGSLEPHHVGLASWAPRPRVMPEGGLRRLTADEFRQPFTDWTKGPTAVRPNVPPPITDEDNPDRDDTGREVDLVLADEDIVEESA